MSDASTEEHPILSREEVWKILVEIGLQERHFNELEAKYRSMTSTWLVGTFGAIGFVMAQNSIAVPIPRLAMAAAIALAGTVGIVLLWNLDVMVYHRLLDACFLSAVLLENETPWLPKIRAEMMRSAPGSGGTLRRIVYFYMGSEGVLLTVAIGCLAGWLTEAYPALILAGVSVSVVAAGGLLLVTWRQSLSKSGGWQRVEDEGLL